MPKRTGVGSGGGGEGGGGGRGGGSKEGSGRRTIESPSSAPEEELVMMEGRLMEEESALGERATAGVGDWREKKGSWPGLPSESDQRRPK